MHSKFRCVMCTEKIPEVRAIRKGVTCSEECARLFRNERRQMVNRHRSRCRLCNRPGTPEDWALFRAWRKTLPKAKPGRKPGQKNKPRAISDPKIN
jgi:hypothetical protein